MSAKRNESFPKKSKVIKRGRDFDMLSTISGSWEELAKAHCLGRNEKVAFILAYSIAIHHREQNGLTLTYSAAEWQIERDAKPTYNVPPEWKQLIEASNMNEEERTRITTKFLAIQDAHRAPCQIKLEGQSLPDFLTDPSRPHKPVAVTHVMALRGIFGAVDPLPAIFNESDSQAEGANLKDALVAACGTVTQHGMALNLGTFNVAQKTAFEVWLQGADLGFARAIDANQALYDKAPDGSYERLYRLAKIAILEHYRRFTASERPLMGSPAVFGIFNDILN